MAVTSATQAHPVRETAQSRRERANREEREKEKERAEKARDQRAEEELSRIGTRVNIEA
ncbi:MAG: hypothetical protein ACE5EN_01925 [Nitrospinota bacterium]